MHVSKQCTAFLSRAGFLFALLLVFTVSGISQFGSVEAHALRLRSEPNLVAPSIALITKEEVTDGPNIEIPENALRAFVNTDGTVLNVRSGPGTTYTTLGQVSNGTVMIVLSHEDGWCKVLYQDTSIAYVSEDYVKLMTQQEYEEYKASADYRGEQIAAAAHEYLGRPYVYGGNGPDNFDCSGFTKYLYAQFGYTLNRTATDQLDNGVSVEKDELQAGDLVFFRSPGTVKPVSHVGVYIGAGEFIHASTNDYRVRIDSLDTGYFEGIYVYGRHIV